MFTSVGIQGVQGIHGGPDALGVPLHDFSTNANACGPCPAVLASVRAADPAAYPDPHYASLVGKLAAWHGVDPNRIVLAASASEFIHRITTLAQLRGANAVALPAHSYGDYAQAASARGLAVLRPADAGWHTAPLQWACEPSSPTGGDDPALARWREPAGRDGPADGVSGGRWRVVDCAYQPLRLGASHPDAVAWPDTVWQLWTPNKALGLTGVRAAYAIAPQRVQRQELAAIRALAPSWPVGAHGVAMLLAWAGNEAQQWLAGTLPILHGWKTAQQALCTSLGWTVLPGSLANYFVARVPVQDLATALAQLRAQGIKLRDCGSFGLPGHVRMGVLAPASQQALRDAWKP